MVRHAAADVEVFASDQHDTLRERRRKPTAAGESHVQPVTDSEDGKDNSDKGSAPVLANQMRKIASRSWTSDQLPGNRSSSSQSDSQERTHCLQTILDHGAQ